MNTALRTPLRSSGLRSSILGALLLGTVLLWAGCGGGDALPEPGSEAYREAVTAFFGGVAAAQSGSGSIAEEKFQAVTETAPGEPAAWANLGLLALRRNEVEEARRRVGRALELAPESGAVHLLLARVASTEGQFDEAVERYRQVLELEPGNLKAGYALVQELERQGAGANTQEIQSLLGTLRERAPENVVLQLEQLRVAIRLRDAAGLAESLGGLEARADAWPEEARTLVEALRRASEAGDFDQASTALTYLRNTLLNDPGFRQDLDAIQIPVEEGGELIDHFLKLPTPPPDPSPPDAGLTFEAEALPELGAGAWTWVGAFHLTGEEAPVAAAVAANVVRIGTGEPLMVTGEPAGLAAFDFNFDFLSDVAVAGPAGLRLFVQDQPNRFVDVTGNVGLPAAVTSAAYTGVWTADLDSEGDLDLLLGRPDGAPTFVRNRGDGSFELAPLFSEGSGLQDFLWADLDLDGDPDAAFVDGEGTLRIFLNERRGQFRPATLPAGGGPVRAIAPGDVDQDGLLDVVALFGDGTIRRLALEEASWTELARWEGADAARLFIADLDNNGGVDLVASGSGASRVWLSDASLAFQPLGAEVPLATYALADFDEDGRLDLVGLGADGPTVHKGRGTLDYHWQVVRPRAAQAFGDQRVNSFGIGGVIEVRSGLLHQVQPISTPVVHLGLGDRDDSDVIRIIWPNGDVQVEFDLGTNQVVSTPQRLKGSCPWIFTWDGERMHFVTDFLWRSPLGLSINAQEVAGVMMTEDRVKIEGRELAPRDGYYDLRITAELWETHFFDHVSLLVVDHPAETEIFIDERFAFPPPDLDVRVTALPRPVARAIDHRGRDVTDVVQTRDERYVTSFELGRYQGIAEEHHLELELGDEVPADGRVLLLASGYIRPTDSSINVALSQGSGAPPTGLILEVPDGRGGWKVAKEGLGFPAGKRKTIVLDLAELNGGSVPRRLRLRTNLEIYWDRIAWALEQPEAELAVHHLDPETADLRYRGFSTVRMPDRFSPETPSYDELEGTAPRWRDLTGYYTRYGDVRPLLTEIDDRYVIMNAGDELRFRFPALAPPPAGWRRDFVLVGDGWVKDGDLNTFHSETVHPLPRHDEPDYSTPIPDLRSDPVYQRYPDDWVTYHTRYVTPDRFFGALRPSQAAREAGRGY